MITSLAHQTRIGYRVGTLNPRKSSVPRTLISVSQLNLEV